MAFQLDELWCNAECQKRKNTKTDTEYLKAQAMLQATAPGESDNTLMIVGLVAGLVVVGIVVFIIIKKKKKK